MNTVSIMEDLISKGYKNTRIRQNLVEILFNTSTPLTITDILLILKSKKLNPNKTTIYREIEFLKGQEILQEVGFGDGKKRYEGSSDEHHHHIVCVNCKKVKDIQMKQDVDKLMEKITKQAGYKSVGHSLEFFGLCQNCQK